MNEIAKHTASDEISLNELWKAVKSRKRLIFVITSAALILSAIVSLLLPGYYAATASIMPPQHEDVGGGLASSLGGGLGMLAGGFLGSSSQADLWTGILKSSSVNGAVIERFRLKELYGKETLDETLKTLAKRVEIDKTKEDIVKVTVEDTDPKLAADMANAFIDELDRVNKSAVMTSGQRMRAFVEKRLIETKADLAQIEESLKAFQKTNNAVKLDDQSKAIIEAIGSVKGTLMAKEVEFETLKSYAAPTNPRVQLLNSEINGLKEKLRELEQGRTAYGNRDIFIPTDRIPELSLQYAKLLRDAKVRETLFELLTQQFELARIQEAKDSPTIQVLDSAKPPEVKSRPRRALVVFLSTISGFLISIFLALFLEYEKI